MKTIICTVVLLVVFNPVLFGIQTKPDIIDDINARLDNYKSIERIVRDIYLLDSLLNNPDFENKNNAESLKFILETKLSFIYIDVISITTDIITYQLKLDERTISFLTKPKIESNCPIVTRLENTSLIWKLYYSANKCNKYVNNKITISYRFTQDIEISKTCFVPNSKFKLALIPSEDVIRFYRLENDELGFGIRQFRCAFTLSSQSDNSFVIDKFAFKVIYSKKNKHKEKESKLLVIENINFIGRGKGEHRISFDVFYNLGKPFRSKFDKKIYGTIYYHDKDEGKYYQYSFNNYRLITDWD